VRYAAAFWAVSEEGRVLLQRRPEDGLLGGMMELPSSPWLERRDCQALDAAPLAADWRRLPGEVEHGFTHFRIVFEVYAAERIDEAGVPGVWRRPEEFRDLALPTMTKKVVRHAMNGGRAEQIGLL
jgi:A/G-specific adenine glycosylase